MSDRTSEEPGTQRISSPADQPPLLIREESIAGNSPYRTGASNSRTGDKVADLTGTSMLKPTDTPELAGPGDKTGGTVISLPWSQEVLRPDDLFYLAFEAVNLSLRTTGPDSKQLRPIDPNKPAYLIVHFPSQHFAEEAFYEVAPGFTLPKDDPDYRKPEDKQVDTETSVRNYTAGCYPSGSSRLVFALPPGTSLDYTLESLLKACSIYPLQIPSVARISRDFVNQMKIPALGETVSINTNIIRNIYGEPRINSSGYPVASLGTIENALAALRVNRWLALSEIGRNAQSISDFIPGATKMGTVPKLHPPDYTDPDGVMAPETAIELPWRLILSPHQYAGWAHETAIKPVTGSSSIIRRELWHTRLGVLGRTRFNEPDVNENLPLWNTVRAVWTTDWDPEWETTKQIPAIKDDQENIPFRMSLNKIDRENIVHLSSNPKLIIKNDTKSRPFPCIPINVHRLMLSSLGGWLDCTGLWERNGEVGYETKGDKNNIVWNPLSVSQWRHIATMGRDHYVRVVYEGYLFPFGHEASLIKITERKFQQETPSGEYGAILKQRLFIIVKNPCKQFDPTQYRYFPFTSVRILPHVTPNLDPPETSTKLDSAYDNSEDHFWPCVDKQLFKFHIIAEDILGKKVEFDLPLFYIKKSVFSEKDGEKYISDVQTSYKSDDKNTCNITGQAMAFAPPLSTGETTFEVQKLRFSMLKKGELLYPNLKEAEIILPAVRHLTGDNTPVTVEYESQYILHEWDPQQNAARIYLKLKNPKSLSFGSSDRSGGLMKPDTTIIALSQTMGPVGGNIKKDEQGKLIKPIQDQIEEQIHALTQGNSPAQFNPADFFPEVLLFGCIKLSEIIPPLAITATTSNQLPRLVTESGSTVELLMQDLRDLKGALLNAFPDKNVIDSIDLCQNISGIGSEIVRLLGYFNSQSDLVTKLTGLQQNGSVDATRALRLIGSLNTDLTGLSTALGSPEFNPDSLLASEGCTAKYQWTTNLQNGPLDKEHPENTDSCLFLNNLNGIPATLELNAELRPKSALSESSMNISCAIRNFTLQLVPTAHMMDLLFRNISFRSEGGKKMDVSIELDDDGVRFVGALGFINNLKSIIPMNGFSDPPGLDVTAEGITASYGIAIPTVAVGVFSLQNLKLSGILNLPFIGVEPLTVGFKFCEKHEPFLMTYTIYGGGGYFLIEVSPKGLRRVEATLEFGAAVALNFGVASGCVQVMGGLGFVYEKQGDDDTWKLIGYFRIYGRVSVLRIISTSMELYLGLTYCLDTGNCEGEAYMTIEVDVFCFSKEVTISCHQTIKGGSTHVAFSQMMGKYFHTDELTGESKPVNPWYEYCQAFAPIPEVM